MISHEYKFIFIHIPRTGGTSIESQFYYNENLERNKHWTLNDWKNILDPDIFNSYFKFSFIRNPWDIIISEYSDRWYTDKHVGGPIGEKSGKSLKYFLDRYTPQRYTHCKSFHEYFCPKQIDFVGRFENRKNDLEYISNKIGFDIDSKIRERPVQSQKVNKKHYKLYYNNETRQIVAKRYAKDIEYFGYKFEP